MGQHVDGCWLLQKTKRHQEKGVFIFHYLITTESAHTRKDYSLSRPASFDKRNHFENVKRMSLGGENAISRQQHAISDSFIKATCYIMCLK